MNEFKIPSDLHKNKAEDTHLLIENSNTEIVIKEVQRIEIKEKINPKNECPYIEPPWSQKPENEYKFEVLKSGRIIEEFKDLQKRSYWLFGRLPENNILMAHPTISRYHAVLQYRPKMVDNENKSTIEAGWYIYDIDSTHGTFLNKMRIPSRTFIRMKVGHMLKLGASTRYFILHGPNFDEEPESDLTVTELINLREQKKIEKQKYEEMQQKMREKEGISWGMAEDADEETDLNVNPYATTNNEELFLDDPKKTLRGFFEREGLDLDYKCDEMSPGTFVCRIELPLDDSNGKPIIAEICHKGKKKECVVQCALEACRILDRHGVLRQANHEPLKRKIKTSNSDDDDDFLDRTGDIARKKIRKENLNQNTALSYDNLIFQSQEIAKNIYEIENEIVKYQENSKLSKQNNENIGEDLDDYMKNLSQKTINIDKTEIRKLRLEHQRLVTDQEKIQKLIKIAKPIDLVTSTTDTATFNDVNKKKLILSLFGKRNKFKCSTITKTETIPTTCDKTKINEEVQHAEEKVTEEQSINHNKKDNELDLKLNLSTNRKIKNIECEKEKLDPTNNISKEEFDHLEKNSNITLNENQKNITETEANLNLKKRRNRPRIRNRRENVDIDDTAEFEDADKHSEWIPPINQTGDGITNLNSKFGY